MNPDRRNIYPVTINVETPADEKAEEAAAAIPAEPTVPGEENKSPVQPKADIEIVTLARPLTVNGKTLTEITLNLGQLSGADMDSVEAEVMSLGKPALTNPALSHVYCLRLASRACGINFNDLRRLRVDDAYKIGGAVQTFLLT